MRGRCKAQGGNRFSELQNSTLLHLFHCQWQLTMPLPAGAHLLCIEQSMHSNIEMLMYRSGALHYSLLFCASLSLNLWSLWEGHLLSAKAKSSSPLRRLRCWDTAEALESTRSVLFFLPPKRSDSSGHCEQQTWLFHPHWWRQYRGRHSWVSLVPHQPEGKADQIEKFLCPRFGW